MNKDYGLVDAFKLIGKWIKRILIATLLVGIITAGISLLLPTYYKSITTFYVASPDLAQPAPLTSSQERMDIYGGDGDMDRVLSISNSSKVKDFLIDSFNLYERYDIDRSDSKAAHEVREKLNKLYDVTKTKFDAISVSVEDKDPEVAMKMANAARRKISTLSQQLIKSSQEITLNTYLNNIAVKEQDTDRLADSIELLRDRYGIIDTRSQGEVLAMNSAEVNFELDEYKARYRSMKDNDFPRDSLLNTKAIVDGLVSKQRTVNAQLKKFNQGYNKIKNLESEIQTVSDQSNLLKLRYKQLNAAYEAPFSAIHVIEPAEMPLVKSRPKRSIIVLGVMMLTFVLLCLTALVIEGYRSIDWTT